MSVFLTRTVSSPLLDRRCPLTTVVKGRAAQTEHRHREGTHTVTNGELRASDRHNQPHFLSTVFPSHRTITQRPENSSAQLSTARHIQHTHSAHSTRSELALALISALPRPPTRVSLPGQSITSLSLR